MRVILPISVLLLMWQAPCGAAIDLAPPFQNGAVFQRDRAVPVFGKASPGAAVTVDFAGQKVQTSADPKGRWKVELPAMPASAQGRPMTVTEAGSAPVTVQDVLVGEVWLASGQSNMEWPLSQTRPEDKALAAQPTSGTLRLFHVPRVLSPARLDDVKASWQPATPENTAKFSAVAYFYGRWLSEELKVPVGIIESAWGGSRIEPWWAEEGLEGITEFSDLAKKRRSALPGFPEYDQSYRAYLKNLRDWTTAAEQAMDAGVPAKEAPKPPAVLNVGHGGETGTYQAMIHPLAPYAVRGFLWYQGESNNGDGMTYTTKMRVLIEGWRKQFANPGAPFLFVQIAPFTYGGARAGALPELWTAQREVLKVVPGTGMAGTQDVGNPKDIHPTNKSDVAKRLLQWALADTYGRKNVVRSGPLFQSFKVEGQTLRVTFTETGSGLATRDGAPPGDFEIAGEDGNFSPAQAEITADGKSVVLRSAAVPAPVQARLGWTEISAPNLMNKEKLPAVSFHTHWPVDPTLGTLVSKGAPIVSSAPNTHQWDSGLTDGTWGAAAGSCYATNEVPGFPKTVTLDLGRVVQVSAIRFGTPPIGATKTVAISTSTDGKTFTEEGKNSFPAKTASRKTLKFAPKQVRYVRATFLEQHPKQDNYDANFGFLSEVEVYTPAAP